MTSEDLRSPPGPMAQPLPRRDAPDHGPLLHGGFDAARLAPAYAMDQRLRIENALDPALAEHVADMLERQTTFATVITRNGVGDVIMPAALAAMAPPAQAALVRQLHADAARGIGYHYQGHMIRDTKHAGLNAFLRALNAPATLKTIAELTGRSDIRYADGQATRLVGGHYLTRHLDNPAGESRRLAYVFGFTRRWHPDWGGLLQFYTPDGTPRDAYAPGFNVLSIFDVRHVHAVTYVAPFAAAPRLSITGWFRA